jgi:hypothetical protein
VVRPVRASLRLGWPLYLEFITASHNDLIKSHSTLNFICCLFVVCLLCAAQSVNSVFVRLSQGVGQKLLRLDRAMGLRQSVSEFPRYHGQSTAGRQTNACHGCLLGRAQQADPASCNDDFLLSLYSGNIVVELPITGGPKSP